MGTLLVVDGSDVCRAPIMEFALAKQFGASPASAGWVIESRGLDASPGATMCESASAKLGWSGPAIAFFGAHRAHALSEDDIVDAGMVLTAERQQRSAVVRLRPGSQSRVFTWKEALVLASVLADRVRNGIANAPTDLPGLAGALHTARGTVPLIEPSVRTGVFHWRRGEGDALTIANGHDGAAVHRHVTQETYEVAMQLGARIIEATSQKVTVLKTTQRLEHSRRRRQRA